MVIKDQHYLNHFGTFSSYRAVNILLAYEQRWVTAQERVKNTYWIRKNAAKIHFAIWEVQPTMSLAIFTTPQKQCCHYTCEEVWGVSSVEPWRRRVNKGSVEMCYQNTSLLPTSLSDRPSHVLLTSRYTALRRMSMFGWWYTAGLRRSDRTAIVCVCVCVCVCVPTFVTKIFRNGVIGEVLTTLTVKVRRGAVHSSALAARFRKNMLPCSSTSNCKLSSPSRQ